MLRGYIDSVLEAKSILSSLPGHNGAHNHHMIVAVIKEAHELIILYWPAHFLIFGFSVGGAGDASIEASPAPRGRL